MKSTSAKEFVDGLMEHLTVEMSDHAKWQLRTSLTHAAELAEAETEQKAIEAYCHDCCCTVVGICGIGKENCIALRDYIHKLNER